VVLVDHAKNEGHDGSRNEHHEHGVVERTDEELGRTKRRVRTKAIHRGDQSKQGKVAIQANQVNSSLAYRDKPGHWRFGHLVVPVDLATFLGLKSTKEKASKGNMSREVKLLSDKAAENH
jgi:hypothetical protein